jgi:hypothetical protein
MGADMRLEKLDIKGFATLCYLNEYLDKYKREHFPKALHMLQKSPINLTGNMMTYKDLEITLSNDNTSSKILSF